MCFILLDGFTSEYGWLNEFVVIVTYSLCDCIVFIKTVDGERYILKIIFFQVFSLVVNLLTNV